MSMSRAPAAVEAGRTRAVYRKVTRAIVPYIFVCYLFNYLDRVNVGFAKLQMLDALHMSEAAYGLGAGIFFLGYIACGIPSNLMLARFGPKRWIALIMVVWGLLSISLMFVRSTPLFYALRFCTGAAEAGFFPGLVLYLTLWFPSVRLGRALALFMSAIPLSGVIGGPFSGWILTRFAHAPSGLAAWQWLFLLQGLPTVLLGIGASLLFSDSPDKAKWLSPEERGLIHDDLVADRANRPDVAADSFADVLKAPAVWLLGLLYFSIQASVYAINFWLPTIIQAGGHRNAAMVGWLSAIPYLAAVIFMIAAGWSADRRRERRLHLAIPMVMAASGLLIAGLFADNAPVALVGLTLATAGALTGLPMFWSLANGMLSPAVAAGGVALINSIGQMAGFVSPYVVGWIKDLTHSTVVALYVLSTVALLGSLLIALVPARLVNR